MGVIQYLGDKIKDYRMNRLRGLLEMLEKRYQFNAYRVYVPNSLLANDKINNELVKCLVWYSGDVEALMDLYKSERYNDSKGSFWSDVPSSNRKVHSGLPNLIVSKMPTIVFGSGYKEEIIVYAENGEVDEAKSKTANELYKILKERLELDNKYMAACEKASWSGHIAAKISIDETLTELPIIEFFDRRYFDLVKVRGITQGIIFKTYYETEKNKYLLREYYTTDENGFAKIMNSLWLCNDKEVEIALTSIPQTALLEPEKVLPIKGMLAYDMPNVVPKEIIGDNPYGRSDIMAHSTYDSLDEVVTEMVNEVRDNKTIRYFPQDMLPRDEKGNFLKISGFVNNYMITYGDKDQNAKNEMVVTQIQDKTEQHFAKYKILVTNACNQSELSPLSLGIIGLEAINGSDATTREKSKTTVEMRDKKVMLWKNYLKKVIFGLLQTYDYMSDGKTIIAGYPKQGFDFAYTDIVVYFNDYIGSSQKELIDAWGLAKTQGIASIEMAVEKIHGDDLTEEDKLEEVNRIRVENNLPVDSPDALQNLEPEKV